MKKIIFLFLITIAFTFCKNKKPEAEKPSITTETKVDTPKVESMTFVLDSVKMKSELCEKVDGGKCAEIRMIYVKAIGGNIEVASKINNQILEILGKAVEYSGTTPKNTNTLELLAMSYIVDYDREAVKEENEGFMTHHSSDTEFNVLYDSPKMVCFSMSQYSYMGGAHGNYFTNLYNFNKENGKLIKAKEILKDKEKLSPLLVKEVRKYRDIPADTELKDFGYMYEGDVFPVNDNVGVLKDSLVFIYNTYEIGPYVLGDLVLKIAKTEIKDQLILK